MENAATAVTAATAATSFTSTPPQRQDDRLAMFYHVTDTEEGTGVVEHIVRFMSSSTEVLLFANAFPLISKQLVHAYENTASFNGWEIIIAPPPPSSPTKKMICQSKRMPTTHMMTLRTLIQFRQRQRHRHRTTQRHGWLQR